MADVYKLESQGGGITMHIIVKSHLPIIDEMAKIDSIGEYFNDDFEDMLPPDYKKVAKDEEIEVDLGHNKVKLTVMDWCAIYWNHTPMELCRSEY